jgi:hypothetical protein
LVFIIEKKSVYSAVRTGPLNKAACAPSLKVNAVVTAIGDGISENNSGVNWWEL